jgi:hypothetical protein
MGPAEIGGRVDIEEPARRRQAVWMDQLAGLNQQINIQNG